MNGLALDQIEPLCQRLFVAIKNDKEHDAQGSQEAKAAQGKD